MVKAKSYWISLSSLFLIALLVLSFGLQLSFAQTEKASVSGRVTDQSNAALTDAQVQLRNTETNIVTTVRTNGEGIYVIPSLNPGNYVMSVHKEGFKAVSVTGVTLNVQENLSRNFTLQIGSTAESVTVTAESGAVETTTSDLGTVINETAIHDLPLNGRSFSQLLTLTPGATPISTAQSSGVGVNDLDNLGVPSASIAQPSIQGQWNRSNLYLLDGIINTELRTSAFIMPPIIDAMQEFKVQSHDDQAEYGSVLGGVVNIVTKGGTNQIHGAAWEFLRNNIFDARDHFKDVKPDGSPASPGAFRQNQFGALISGPVLIPKLYNGRNRTFFSFSYEGWRFTQASQVKYTVPTNAELAGDFSNLALTNPIYDPATTQLVGTTYTRSQFVASSDPSNANYNPACTVAAGCPNMIPVNRIDQTMLKFIQTYYARPNLVGGGVLNAVTSAPHVDDSDHYNFRIDEQIGSKDSLFFRYDRLNVIDSSPFDISGSINNSVPADNFGGGWIHTFNSSLLLEAHLGRAQRPFSRSQLDTHGLGPMQALGFSSPGGTTVQLSTPFGGGPLSANPGEQLPNTIGSPAANFSSGLTWIRGGHQFKGGVEYIWQRHDGHAPPYGGYQFVDATTGDPQNTQTGSSLASALLGLPGGTSFTGTVPSHEVVSTWAGYFQDQWKLRRNLTFNYGLRFDHRRPFEGLDGEIVSGFNSDGHWWIGADKLPPPCSQTGAAPCIPGNGTLASITNGNLIQLSPYGSSWAPAPEWDEFGPRLGFAWEVSPKMVVRGGYGVIYDPLTGIDQNWTNCENCWPSTGSSFLGVPINQTGQPLTTVQQTFGTVGTRLPPPDPWSTSSWFMDPHHKDARSQQWNVEIQRQMGANLSASVGYVGSKNDRLDLTGLFNTATTPGAGAAGRPFPWINTTPFFSTSRGSGNYNALEAKLEHKLSNGFQYLVSYTWSKSIDVGSSGWFDAENGAGAGAFSGLQDYYHPNRSRSVSSYDIPHFLSMSGLWELPFGHNRRYLSKGIASTLLGNWELNGVVQLRSGQPYNLAVGGDVANIDNTTSWVNYARPNLVGNPNPSHRSLDEWFNPAAFAVPVNSYGDFGRNVLRTASVYNADFSLFKNFPVGERFVASFRAQFFNAFNIQNYGPPNALIGAAGAGQVISNVLPPREMQFGLHLEY